MVYKKYIEKNGKIYGPYVYHSKRVDGKVVSEYHGPKKKKKELPKLNKFKKPLIFLAAFIVLVSLFWVGFFNIQFTGKSILSLEGEYIEGKPLNAMLNLGLKKGELIPESARIIFENNGKSYEYNISDLLIQDTTQGEFYLEGETIIGNGSGYGRLGSKRAYPDVYFRLNVTTAKIKLPSEPTPEIPTEPAPSTEESEIIEEENITEPESSPEIPENITEEIPTEESEIIEEENITKEPIVEEEIPVEETPTEEPTTEPEIIKEVSAEEPEIVEETQIKEVEEVPIEEPDPEPTPEPEPTITGKIVKGITGFVTNLFLGLTPTGQVIEGGIQGDVSYSKEFTYNLKQGETITLIPESVSTETEYLPDSAINIEIQNKKAIITTNYFVEEKGFGEEYMEENITDYSINLTNLGINFVPGDLTIKLAYNGEELNLLETALEEGIFKIEQISETPTESILIEEELNILNKEFGIKPIRQSAKEYKNWILVKFELGNYEIEHSYDKNLPTETLKIYIEKDKQTWLKDIANTLIKEKTIPKPLVEFEKISPINFNIK
ncbi:hypothetical protein HOD29_04015 [archaeon]|jgi:hypothetical protein|nr:hypothetical protein [archaeon]